MGGVGGGGGGWRWDCLLTTVFCPPDSRTAQSVHCIEVYKYEVRGAPKPRPQAPPLPQQEEGLGWLLRGACCPLLSDRSTVCFQSCARPQLGKWISCLATDSDWMVGS